MALSQLFALPGVDRRSAARSGLKRSRMIFDVMNQTIHTAMAAQACHQSVRPADQNNATPMPPRLRIRSRRLSIKSFVLEYFSLSPSVDLIEIGTVYPMV